MIINSYYTTPYIMTSMCMTYGIRKREIFKQR